MAGDKKRRQNHLRKTKAQLVDELEGFQRELGELIWPSPLSNCTGEHLI